MSGTINEQELVQYIAAETGAEPESIRVVLKHEQTYINTAEANEHGEVEIDSDDLVDYVMSRKDVKLDEVTVEAVLDAEMDYLMDKGIAVDED
ncbi:MULTISPECIES: hypothetical protein [Paenibacillus]|uniref:Uncharacterized protein n=1 Tax=Paenibacillus albilobatus TaxID=2716884 RepID=A0A919XHK4_9BACL|nr:MULTISPECIES: hypothetical protein [Paenibacillus]MDR9853560.1 hypothetical protein [Paenibacillus sp. VCA1]GIO32972.1 hypothetical protein J2TS6_41130 [Paenibacillus albilobatus]